VLGDAGGTSAVPAERLIGAFEVREPVLAALRSVDEVAAAPFAVVRIETEANIAVGVAPWGPFAQLSASPDAADSIAWAGHPQLVVSERDASDGRVAARIEEILGQVADDQGVVVIGKALHRYGFAREVVEGLRAERTTLAVDMGWPSDDRAYADIATFGASRSVGRALMALLASAENPR